MSQIPPHEVANKLNYHDSSHFSKVFKKHTGQTPLQFQKFESHRIIDPEK
ncbi:AraC family transcriptional regulator [Enterococcus sp. DIV0421]